MRNLQISNVESGRILELVLGLGGPLSTLVILVIASPPLLQDGEYFMSTCAGHTNLASSVGGRLIEALHSAACRRHLVRL
jgi:hypothetical protein